MVNIRKYHVVEGEMLNKLVRAFNPFVAVFIIYFFLALAWRGLELVIYRQAEGKVSDDIVAIAFAYTLYKYFSKEEANTSENSST